MSKPIVAIVGRPNVGKSTLFNQIGKKRVSIVDDMPGVTRDRIYLDAEWLNQHFTMIDTGGIEFDESNHILKSMRQQAQLAMDEADVILFLVDGRSGLTTADEEVARLLRSTKKPVILAVNKIDSPQRDGRLRVLQPGPRRPDPHLGFERHEPRRPARCNRRGLPEEGGRGQG